MAPLIVFVLWLGEEDAPCLQQTPQARNVAVPCMNFAIP